MRGGAAHLLPKWPTAYGDQHGNVAQICRPIIKFRNLDGDLLLLPVVGRLVHRVLKRLHGFHLGFRHAGQSPPRPGDAPNWLADPDCLEAREAFSYWLTRDVDVDLTSIKCMKCMPSFPPIQPSDT